MDAIAYVFGETFIYWTSIILSLGTLTAVLFFWAFYLDRSGNAFGAALGVPVAIMLSLVLSRFAHWYCRADGYSSFAAAMTDFSSGGYALMGVFAACIVTAVLLYLLHVVKNLGDYLDCMCLAGSAGIAVGRLACFFSAADRGQIVQGITALPFVYPVTNAVSGAVEYRLATFVLQSMITALIFLILTAVYFAGRGKGSKSGSITVLFLLMYGASQVVLDSTRYDSLYLRSNGFISIVQILGAVALVTGAAVYSVRLVKRTGFRYWFIAIWIFMAALLGGAGYMEYHVQRHGDQAVFAYSIMSACLIVFILVNVCLPLVGKLVPAKAEKPQSDAPAEEAAETIPPSQEA